MTMVLDDGESDFSGEYEPCPLCGDMVEAGFICRRVRAWRATRPPLVRALTIAEFTQAMDEAAQQSSPEASLFDDDR